jgi:hypothetical protein
MFAVQEQWQQCILQLSLTFRQRILTILSFLEQTQQGGPGACLPNIVLGVGCSIFTADNDKDTGRTKQPWQGGPGACLPIIVLGVWYSVFTAEDDKDTARTQPSWQGGAQAYLPPIVPGVCYSAFPAKETPNPGRLSHCVVRQTYGQDDTGNDIAAESVQCSQVPGKVGELACPPPALIASLPVHCFPVSSQLPCRSTIWSSLHDFKVITIITIITKTHTVIVIIIIIIIIIIITIILDIIIIVIIIITISSSSSYVMMDCHHRHFVIVALMTMGTSLSDWLGCGTQEKQPAMYRVSLVA